MKITIDMFHRAYSEMDGAMQRGDWDRVIEMEQCVRRMHPHVLREETPTYRARVDEIGALHARVRHGITQELARLRSEITALKTGRRAADAYQEQGL